MTISSSKTIKYTIAGIITVVALMAITALAAWAPAGTIPPTEPSGATPQDKYYHPATTAPIGTQEKVGRLGVGAQPPTGFDFNTEGNASFLGGIWASSGVFFRNVCIGTPIVSTSFCPGGLNTSTLNIFGTFQSQGGSSTAGIQNDELRHSTVLADGTDGLERVCSTSGGILRLCNISAGPASFCDLNPTHFSCMMVNPGDINIIDNEASGPSINPGLIDTTPEPVSPALPGDVVSGEGPANGFNGNIPGFANPSAPGGQSG